MKPKYEKPRIERESLEVDASFALACGAGVSASTISCLERNMPNEYEMLVFGLGINPGDPMSVAEGFTFSSSETCIVSCYQGPFDIMFSS